MCSLIGSYDLDRILHLYELNLYRGNRTSSVSNLNIETMEVQVNRFDRALTEVDIKKGFVEGQFNILHMQAPTGPDSGIHPAEASRGSRTGYLWHNGLLLGFQGGWDTQALSNALIGSAGYEALNEFRGSFACMFAINGESFNIFRNALSPLFLSGSGDISSTRFEGGESIQCDVVYSLVDEDGGKFVRAAKFKTVDNPYDFL